LQSPRALASLFVCMGCLNLLDLELDVAERFEIPVGGVMKLEIFDFRAICDVALRLRGLPLQRSQASSISATMSPTRRRFCWVSSIFLSACFLRLLNLVIPAASSISKATFLGFGADNEADFPLLDDRIGLGASPRAEKEIRYVAQPNGVLLMRYSLSPER
jgi:hypothetical protein